MEQEKSKWEKYSKNEEQPAQEQNDDTVRLPRVRHFAPMTPAPTLLPEELTVLSTAITESYSKKRIPLSQQMKPKITQSLPTISLITQLHEARWLWPVIVILSAVASGLMNSVFTTSPLRPFIVLWFLFVCPGMLLVRFLHLKEFVAEWVLAVVLSFAVDAIVAGIQVYMRLWSPIGTLIIVICLCLGIATVQLTTMHFTILPVVKLPRISLSRKRRAVLAALFTVFVALLAGASFWPYAEYQPSHSASVSLNPPHKTTLHPSPEPQSTAPKGKSYQGTIYNLATNVSTKMSLVYLPHREKISGTFTGLYLNNPFSGTIDATNHIQIKVTESEESVLLSLDGQIKPDNTIIGSYCSLDQIGKCTGKYGYGVWSVTPAPKIMAPRAAQQSFQSHEEYL